MTNRTFAVSTCLLHTKQCVEIQVKYQVILQSMQRISTCPSIPYNFLLSFTSSVLSSLHPYRPSIHLPFCQSSSTTCSPFSPSLSHPSSSPHSITKYCFLALPPSPAPMIMTQLLATSVSREQRQNLGILMIESSL